MMAIAANRSSLKPSRLTLKPRATRHLMKFTTIVVLRHSVDLYRRGRSLACFRRQFAPRTKHEHRKHIGLVVSSPSQTLSDLLQIQVASLFLRLCVSFCSPLNLILHLSQIQHLQCLFQIPSFCLVPSVLIHFPPLRSGPSGCSPSAFLSLSTLLDPLPSPGLVSLRRHCCLNLMPLHALLLKRKLEEERRERNGCQTMRSRKAHEALNRRHREAIFP